MWDTYTAAQKQEISHDVSSCTIVTSSWEMSCFCATIYMYLYMYRCELLYHRDFHIVSSCTIVTYIYMCIYMCIYVCCAKARDFSRGSHDGTRAHIYVSIHVQCYISRCELLYHRDFHVCMQMHTYIYVSIHVQCYISQCELLYHRDFQIPRKSIYGVASVSRIDKLQVSFVKEPHKRDYILYKRRVILSILLTIATP